MDTKAHAGDVFLIPLGEHTHGVGQVVSRWGDELYVAIYDLLVPTADANPEIVIGHEPLFAALSLDAKLWAGHWRIIGSVRNNLADIREPVFKVWHGDAIHVESRDRSTFRQATTEEAEKLRFRSIVAPVRLEAALKAHNGIGDWNSKYDELRYDYAVESSKVLAA